jgi:hypothetical protein
MQQTRIPQSNTDEAAGTATLRPPCRELPPRRRRRVPQPIVIYPKPRYRRSERGERMLTVATLATGDELLPMIRMRGRWLARLGFTRDARIVVSEEQGRIVLTLAGEE